ncbi:hypothetical protein [Lutibacter sp.]|uniref:hypothetical protein n=1 Tax=Lutibacter sp. TaxID=1925666 RepID=UPI0027355AC0|nr:hypothetical protein [Lutibacter sp.]MDP3313318.1 hypothetical protein [Lutibacter sp.]
MDWNDHFGTFFFETWQKAGLPHHQEFLIEYIETREHGNSKSDWIKNSAAISSVINGSQLHSVYGFGATMGKIFAVWFSLNKSSTEAAADWCGRFNLGISLFDYICDEMDDLDEVTSLKVFQPFINKSYSKTSILNPAQKLLSNLAGSVLLDLEKTAIKKEGSQKTDVLFKVMKQLFEAQNFLSKERLSDHADLNKIKKALYLKSAEPFRMMAEYTARMGHSNDQSLLKNARAIGKAVGYCYWLIDDAKDVWIDLEAEQWNLFLHLAASEDPLIFTKKRDAFMDSHLLSIWKQSKHAEKISSEIIKRLLHAIRKLELSEKVERHTLGLVSASLWQWYKY